MIAIETFRQLSDVDLVAAYADARRGYAEKKFARDTQRAARTAARESVRGRQHRRAACAA